jgi:hypothetical protein
MLIGEIKEDIKNKIWKEWTQVHEECLWKDKEEWRRLFQKIIHLDGKVTG